MAFNMLKVCIYVIDHPPHGFITSCFIWIFDIEAIVILSSPISAYHPATET